MDNKFVDGFFMKAPRAGAPEFVKGSVFAITERYRTDSADEYQRLIKRDQWPVVLPELVFSSSAYDLTQEP